MAPDITDLCMHTVGVLPWHESIQHSIRQDGTAWPPVLLRGTNKWKIHLGSYWQHDHCMTFNQHIGHVGSLVVFDTTWPLPLLSRTWWVAFCTSETALHWMGVLHKSYNIMSCNILRFIIYSAQVIETSYCNCGVNSYPYYKEKQDTKFHAVTPFKHGHNELPLSASFLRMVLIAAKEHTWRTYWKK